MKNFFILYLSLCLSFLQARSYIISPLSLPQQQIFDLDAEPCDEVCLNTLYDEEKLFSFVAKFNPNIKDQVLRSKLIKALQQLGISIEGVPFEKKIESEKNQNGKGIKIALLVPKDIVGRYSMVGVNTILAYLTSRNTAFLFEVFDSKNEESQNLNRTYEEIKQKDFDCVIAMLTVQGAQNLLQDTTISLPTYIPTVNVEQIPDNKTSENLFFGGINYQTQIAILAQIANDREVVEYDDASAIGSILQKFSQDEHFNVIYQETITSDKAARFSEKIKNQENDLSDRVVLLNIPVMKTGLILPQVGFLKNRPKLFLSTQINYNPSLLLLIKPKDRQNFYVVNAIGKTNSYLIEYGLLLGSDLQYDWVSYSIGIGVEALLLNQGQEINRFFSETIGGSQVKYTNRIYKTLNNSFIEVNMLDILSESLQPKKIKANQIELTQKLDQK